MSLLRKLILGVWLLALAFWAGGSSVARAQDKSAEEARAHYLEGNKAYNLAEFDRAAKEYKEAYRLKPDAVLLYNIAQAYRLAKDYEQALLFYRSYLRSQPQARNRAEVEDRIVKLEEDLEKQRAQKAAATPPPTTPPPTTAPPTTPPPTTPPPANPPPGTPIASSDSSTNSPPGMSSGAIDVSATAPPPEEPKPIYKKWWFWAGAGAVVIGIVAVSIAASGSGSRRSPPSTDLGNTRIF